MPHYQALSSTAATRRSAPKVLHMPTRTGSSCRILPRPEGYLDSMHRGALDLYPTEPPFDGLNALIMPKRDLQVRSLQRVLGSKRSPITGLSFESRVRATTSAVQGFWCRSPYTISFVRYNERHFIS